MAAPARFGRRFPLRLLAVAVLIAAAGVVPVDDDAVVAAQPAPAFSARVGAQQTGIASWYGRWHHGLLTASGDLFNMWKLTAAHQTLPLGTEVRVTNLDNGRSIDVRVNDRGPYVPGRILDLSNAAARAIDGLRTGLIPVRVTVVGLPDAQIAGRTHDRSAHAGDTRVKRASATRGAPARIARR